MTTPDTSAGAADVDAMPAHLDDDADFRRQQRLRVLAVAAAGLVFVGLLGVIPWALGFGPFASRLIGASDISVWVINQSDTPVRVEVSHARSLTVPPGHIDQTTSLSGPIVLTVFHAETGAELESFNLRASGPVFYNALGGTCLVVFDLTRMYGGQGGEMTIHARLLAEDRIHVVEADTLIRPRHPAPPQAIGTVHWVEDFACGLVREAEDHMVLARAEMRLRERLELLEERQRRMQQGSP